MKGWCVPVLKVLLWAFGAAVSGLCLAAGIGVLLAAPASAATQSPAGIGGSLVSAVSAATAGAVAPSCPNPDEDIPGVNHDHGYFWSVFGQNCPRS